MSGSVRTSKAYSTGLEVLFALSRTTKLATCGPSPSPRNVYREPMVVPSIEPILLPSRKISVTKEVKSRSQTNAAALVLRIFGGVDVRVACSGATRSIVKGREVSEERFPARSI